jgi:mRNA-degrading endonuclease RelE of RelBE toxin-antitoxin system
VPFLIDAEASSKFTKKVKQLRKSFPHVDKDLAGLYEDLSSDYKSHGDGVPGFQNAVWKFRCPSTDMNRGKSGGFRVLAFVNEGAHTIYPFFVYSKAEYAKAPGQQPPAKDIKEWLKTLVAELNGTPDEPAE